MGHTIDNISVAPIYSGFNGEEISAAAGLFGVIDSTGVVRNLQLTNSQAFSFAYLGGAQLGLLAGINRGHIENVFASGGLSSAGGNYIGGLVGVNTGLIERSAANVSVDGSQSYLGGLVGWNAGTISQCYETGNVSAPHPSSPGGLVGFNTGVIEQSFVTGALQGDWQYTPPAIASTNEGTITADNYWDIQTTGVQNGGGAPQANGLTTAQMSNPASFATWDFSANGAWAMPAGATHPVLAWQVNPN